MSGEATAGRGVVLRRSCIAVVALVAAGVVVRVTLRDTFHWLAPLFYATPPGLLVLGALASCAAAWRLRSRAIGGTSVVLLVAALAFAGRQFRSPGDVAHAATPSPRPLRGVLWNVEHGDGGWDRVAELARATDPDVVWVVEGPGPGDGGFAALARAFPEHTLRRCGGHLCVLVRGDADVVEERKVGAGGYRATLVRLRVLGREFESLVCDITSRPLVDRLPLLDLIRAWGESRAAPLLIVGDFNTPTESAGFDAWRAPFRHAFESAGTGWAPTWPMPVPVLEIDHVWTNAGIDVRRCEHGSTTASDHRPVELEFDVVPR